MNRSNLIIVIVVGLVLAVTGVIVSRLVDQKSLRRDADEMERAVRNPMGRGDGGEARLIDAGIVPPFTLTSSEGKPFGLDDLKGKVWVADFIFTSCAGICPQMTGMMKKLQTDLDDLPDVQFVSISVDPKRDTVEALAEYAEEYGADIKRWHFLRGDLPLIQALSVEGFHLGDKENPLNHAPHFALVDAEGHIRGYYNGTGPDRVASVDALAEDIRTLVKRGGR